MKKYSLYLESGPRQKTTMVHVLAELGCIAKGQTTDLALAATPNAIHQWLGFLKRHGEKVDPTEEFEVKIAVHVTEGAWLGYGDPTPGFPPDFDPLSMMDQEQYIRHLDWLQTDILERVRLLPLDIFLAQPQSGERSLNHMLLHVAESQAVYLRYLVGRDEQISSAFKGVNEAPGESFLANLEDFWKVYHNRLESLTKKDRQAHIPHGQVTWTARRAFRRMLEHAWEHLVEISERLKIPV